MRWKKDVYNIEYAIIMSKIKCPSLCVMDRLINSSDVQFLGCRNCIFSGVDKEFGLGIAGCPYECTGDEDILR